MNQNQKINENELIYDEEVSDDELHSKLGVDDHIYITHKKGIYGGPVLLIFVILLVLAALFSLFYGLISFSKDINGRKIGVYTDEYHLKVIHSNYEYGGIIDSFSKYNSSSNYYSYKFSVSNNNSVDLDYSVVLEVENKSDKLNVNDVKYSLLRNGISVQSDHLDSLNNKLYTATSLKNSNDEYEIRLWSDSLKKDLNFKFKIRIQV